jgi:hypothetical protein
MGSANVSREKIPITVMDRAEARPVALAEKTRLSCA